MRDFIQIACDAGMLIALSIMAHIIIWGAHVKQIDGANLLLLAGLASTVPILKWGRGAGVEERR